MGVFRYLFSLSYDKIKDQDIFEKFITLTYNGEESFKSFFGGLVSSLIKLGILIQFAQLAITVFTRNNTTKSNK